MQSSSQIITNKPTSSFLQAGCPSCRPTNSVKALNGKISHSVDLLTPSSPGGLPTFSVTTNCSWLLWGGLPCLSSALWCQYPRSRLRLLSEFDFRRRCLLVLQNERHYYVGEWSIYGQRHAWGFRRCVEKSRQSCDFGTSLFDFLRTQLPTCIKVLQLMQNRYLLNRHIVEFFAYSPWSRPSPHKLSLKKSLEIAEAGYLLWTADLWYWTEGCIILLQYRLCTYMFTLHASEAAAQCIAIGPVSLCVCLWVCYHDNSKLRASIFTKLGL